MLLLLDIDMVLVRDNTVLICPESSRNNNSSFWLSSISKCSLLPSCHPEDLKSSGQIQALDRRNRKNTKIKMHVWSIDLKIQEFF